MPYELLKRYGIFKKTIYNPHDPISTMFSAVKEPLEFSDITGSYYTQIHVVHIAYIILYRTGKFGLTICGWNCMPEIQKTWMKFKQFFWTSHQELRETSNLTVEDAGMHHANMVRHVVAGLQKDLQQDQAQMETMTVVQAPVDHVDNIDGIYPFSITTKYW